MLLGLAVLAKRWQIGPRSGQTVLSQIMAMAVGRGWAYYVVSITITIVLALAANTSFGGLPVLASLVARDNYLPHLFTMRGDRQVFSNGIVVLAVLAGALLVAVDGNTNTLIPLFAIGVFIGFTLSQTGLVVHWRRTRPPGWRRRAAINGIGAVITAVATIVFLVSKFTEGAWVVVIAIPAFIFLFLRIHAYYERTRKELRIDEMPVKPVAKRTIVIVPVNRVSRLAEHALAEAESLGQDVIAVTVVLRTGDEAARYVDSLRRQWRRWDPGVPLQVLHTDYASVVQPIVQFIDDVRADHPDDQIVVLIPVIRPNQVPLPAPAQPARLGPVPRLAQPRATSSWPGSRFHWSRRRRPPTSPPARSPDGLARVVGQRPFHTGSRFSINAVAPSFASSLPNTFGCHSAARVRARSRSVDAVRTSSFVARSASGPLRAMRSASAAAASSTSPGATT